MKNNESLRNTIGISVNSSISFVSQMVLKSVDVGPYGVLEHLWSFLLSQASDKRVRTIIKQTVNNLNDMFFLFV